jgi:hypothetical protein
MGLAANRLSPVRGGSKGGRRWAVRVQFVNDWALEERLFAATRPLVVMFVASGHGIREVGDGEFFRLAAAYPEADFLVADLFENPSLKDRFLISKAPTTLIFVYGLEHTRHIGGHLEFPLGRILGPHPRISDEEAGGEGAD